jgi:hypothetical protein
MTADDERPTLDAELHRALRRVVGSDLPPGPERDDLAREVMQALPRVRGVFAGMHLWERRGMPVLVARRAQAAELLGQR